MHKDLTKPCVSHSKLQTNGDNYLKYVCSLTIRVQYQLEDLLDLKQKQANVSEARIARVSGNTITVFTIVTIIFLPASFMAAFFALPIAEYPFVDELFHLD